MKKVKIQEMVIGKNPTGLRTPRFRLMSGETNPLDLMVVHYKDLHGEAMVTDVYKVVDILNEYVDEYHQKKISEDQ